MEIIKHRQDEDEAPRLPLPTQVVSNGEYAPIPPSPQQRRVAELAQAMADERAKKLGMRRRDFLRSAAGTATVMLAMNQVYGCGGGSEADSSGPAATPSPTLTQTATATRTPTASPSPTEQPFNVCDEDTRDPERARQVFAAPYFVVDVQTHHVDLDGAWASTPFLRSQIATLRFRDFAACSQLTTNCRLSLITRENYIKELFLDSETAIGVMSGVPPGAAGILPNDTMAQTRDEVNERANSPRMLSQMLIEPTLPEGSPGRTTIFDIERNVQELRAVAIKCYPGSDLWWLDDEAVAYPMYERAVRAGIRVVSVHKGFPSLFGAQSARRVQSIDIPKAARDWPQLNFVIYHSGYFPSPVTLDDGTTVPAGIEQFVSVMEQNPDLTNVYAEIGSTFAIAAANGGTAVAELIGRLLKVVGPDRILWGTDSVWWGSPQWQIDALKALQIPESLQQQRGYPALTDSIRAKIFGGNAARLYGLDIDAVRCTLASDAVTTARAEWLAEGQRAPLLTHGPRTRREFLRLS